MDCSFKVYKLYICVCNALFYVQQRKQTLSMSLGKLKGVFRLTDEKRYYHEHRTGGVLEPRVQTTSSGYRT